ncbi:class I SAM-dependent methyltransferase [candidate division KSB1 bacterium]|nr:class I SAM-dependent methyltransferase [candidate division KSB1 bacterium]
MQTEQTWDNYARFAEARGQLVYHIINSQTNVIGKQVLDFGCGTGGTAYVFARHGAHVTAVDVKDTFRFPREPIKFRFNREPLLKSAKDTFDIIIMQDVIEHVPTIGMMLPTIVDCLKPDGLLYLSTPNRWSPFNTIADPHWGIPFVSMLSRRHVIRIVHNIFHIDRRDRQDWPALFGYRRLISLLEESGLQVTFVNRQVVRYLHDYPESVFCAPWHLWLFEKLKQTGLLHLLHWLVNDRRGLFNRLLNPTWYMIASK